MDAKVVDRAIRGLIRALLKERGFDRFAARYSWRRRERVVDCIHFWSPYNWVEAEVKGITTFSFQIDLGIYFRDIPPDLPGPVETKESLLPRDSQCHLRRGLRKLAEQPECSMPFLWYIRPDGANLEEVIRSARQAIETEALPWFEQYGDAESFLDLLLTDAVENAEVGWGYGAKDSVVRRRMIEYLAQGLGV